MVIVLWPLYREKIAQHMLRAIAVLHFPIYAPKSCPAPAALAAGAGHYFSLTAYTLTFRGWSGGAKVLGKLPVPGRPTILITVGQGPTALAVGAGGGCLDIFTLIYPFSSLSPSLWETARYRLKYCLKGPLNPKQPTNEPTNLTFKPPYRGKCLKKDIS